MVLAGAAAVAQTAPLRRPGDHPDFGLPDPGAVWLPYAADAEHPCNRVWRQAYLVRCVPAEVAAALPREHGDDVAFFVKGWYFGKRAGTAADERLFGGDGRQLPVEGFDAAGSAALRAALASIDGDVAAELRRRPRAAVWFQHDLLRLSRRLLDTGNNPELLPPLAQCVHRLALPAELLRSDTLRTVTVADVAAAVPGFDPARAVEIERRSTRLFDAEFVQLWSSVYVQVPEQSPTQLAAWLATGKQRGAVPIGALAVLVQGIVAVADDGTPCATDLVLEVRTQRLSNREPLAAANATTTHDGVDLAMWSLARTAVRDLGPDARSVPFAAFRAIDMQSQELFRDYGTLKHTTYAAQCALCHRREHSGDEALAGFSALRAGSEPRPVTAAGERRRRAEGELAKLLAQLPDHQQQR